MMPALFVSHGAPTLATHPGKTGIVLREIAAELQRPKAILVVSAHWDTAQPSLSLAAHPETIHDFGGFPRELYTLDYPAPGAPGLTMRTLSLLHASGFDAVARESRGLDHGAWVPLRLLYPTADIPVTQLSIQGLQGPAYHYRLGQALHTLREEGVLILASGAVTHNLSDFRFSGPDVPVPTYVTTFSGWVAEHMASRDDTSLLAYRSLAPDAVRAHPTEDHLLPLFVALGATIGEKTQRYDAGTTYGILAMDIYRLGT